MKCAGKILLLFLGAFIPSVSSAHVTPDSIGWRAEAEVRGGYAFNSNAALMQRMAAGTPVTHFAGSVHVKTGISFNKDRRTSSVTQGIGLGLNTFAQASRVGTPAAVYVFQSAPIAVLSSRLSLDYEWNFGASFGWRRTTTGYDLRSNLVVGSSTNAYINLGVMLRYRVTPELTISAGLDLTHFSNGNTSWPNPGVNTIGTRVGVTRTIGKGSETTVSPFKLLRPFRRHLTYDIMAYGAWRKAYFPYQQGAFTEEGERVLLPGHFGVAGITFSPMLKLHPAFACGVSADIQWSGNNALEPGICGFGESPYGVYTVPPFIKQVGIGLSARAELIMPIFSVNAGVGYGVAGTRETRRLYQTVTLKTYLTRQLYLNVGYRLYQFRSPSNLMLGLGLTIGK